MPLIATDCHLLGRYLPALFWGCVPVMSDRLEGMPLEDLPDVSWNESALAVELPHLKQLPRLLQVRKPPAAAFCTHPPPSAPSRRPLHPHNAHFYAALPPPPSWLTS